MWWVHHQKMGKATKEERENESVLKMGGAKKKVGTGKTNDTALTKGPMGAKGKRGTGRGNSGHSDSV